MKDAIRNHLVPSLTKHGLNYLEMELVSLPARYGGMTFDDPVADSYHLVNMLTLSNYSHAH